MKNRDTEKDVYIANREGKKESDSMSEGGYGVTLFLPFAVFYDRMHRCQCPC